MNAKEYLSRAFELDRRITIKIEQLKQLRDLAQKCTSVISDLPKGKTAGSRLEETVCRIVDYETDLNADIDALVDMKREIERVIAVVPDTMQQLLLQMRYLNFSSWEDIAEALCVTYNHVFKIHRDALNYLDENRNWIAEDSAG